RNQDKVKDKSKDKGQDATQDKSSYKAAPDSQELSSHDTPATFKVRVNLVLVRVVVRDSEGKPVGNLKKEDFLLFDNRKPQTISTFSVETPASRVVKNVNINPNAEPASTPAETTVSGVAQRFVTMAFDDVHLSLEDSAYVRTSAQRFLRKLGASDRVSMYSTSGQLSQDFTQDRQLLETALLKLVPRPRAMSQDFHACPD